MDDVSKRVSERLKKVMLSKGLSQSDVARATGLTHPTVNAFCNARGKPLNASLIAIAEAVGISVDDLIAPEPAGAAPDDLAEAAALRALRVFRDEQSRSAPQDIAPEFPKFSDPADEISAAQIREQLMKLSTRPRLLAQAALFLEAIIEANQDLLAAATREADKKKRG